MSLASVAGDFAVHCGVHIFVFTEVDSVSKRSYIGDTFSLDTCACFCQILQCPHQSLMGRVPQGAWGFCLGFPDTQHHGTKESGFLPRAPVTLPTCVQSSWVTCLSSVQSDPTTLGTAGSRIRTALLSNPAPKYFLLSIFFEVNFFWGGYF